MRKIWDLMGGVHPPENKQQSVQQAIAHIPLPEEFILPLNQHIGAPAVPVVKVGDAVLKGQLLADAQGVFSASIHAPSSGTIHAIEDRVIAHPSGMTAQCIVLLPDGQDRWCPLTPCEDPDHLDHFELVKRIQRAGLAGLGGAGFPTAVKLNPRSTDQVETLILNGTECEPYITADDMLMRERPAEIIAGAELLARIVGNPKEILLGIEDNKPEAIAALRKAAQGSRVEIVEFPTKYPSGGEKQLIQILTGKEVPSGKIPAQIGVLVQNVGTAYATWRAIRYGEPLIERVTTVVGEALQTQRNVWARIGTPMAHILTLHGFDQQQSARLIVGGPMMGFTALQAEVPVVKTTNCILVPSHSEMPPPPPAQPCIRCGLCAEACPANLLPQQLYWYARAEDYEKLDNHNLFDCIECGACSYVCPSAIPLVQYYRAAKGTMRQQEAEKIKADRARLRFEQRKERIAKAEAEKEAKRAARKKAAEQAKAKLADKSTKAAPSSDPVAQAIARAQAQTEQPTPEIQRKKLARALSSAESRVDRLQNQMAECEDAAQAEKLAASLKQAELKVADASHKLHQFDKSTGNSASSDTAADKPSEGSNSSTAAAKLSASPAELQQKTLETLRKRLATAEQKVAQAQEAQSPTLEALQQGLEKLRSKLAEAEQQQADAAPDTTPTRVAAAEQDAAARAIARAQAQAERSEQMSPEEKQQAHIEALQKRLTKARTRLEQAQAEQSEHQEALQNSVTQLEAKLAQAQQTTEESQ